MIKTIKNTKQLKPYLREKIEDAGIRVDISEDITAEQIANIKVDDYYANLRPVPVPMPKTIDMLTAVDCECDTYVLYLLELKNVKRPSDLVMRDIHEKFENTLNDFMSKRFGEIFLNSRFKYRRIFLYLVSDAYRMNKRFKSFEEYRALQKRVHSRDSLKVEVGLACKVFRFRGRTLQIKYDIPPNPIIQRYL